MAEEHVQKYINRIESQHRGRQRYIAHCTALLELVEGAYETIAEMPEKFNLDSASGGQLDILGQSVGAKRGSLNDDDYRLLIYSRIMKNHWNGQTDTFDAIWDQTIGRVMEASFEDNQDMTMSVTIESGLSQNARDMITSGEILPKPMGVGYTVVYDNSDEIILTAETDYAFIFAKFAYEKAGTGEHYEFYADMEGEENVTDEAITDVSTTS